jgi:hypothetical protein
MVNLSTVYVISIVLASISGMGAAFVGNKFHPIIGGSAKPPPSPSEVYAEAQKTAEMAERLANAQIPPTATEEPVFTPSPEPEPAPTPQPEPTPEQIPAVAPTDENNQPPEIPTYLPTSETTGGADIREQIKTEFGKDDTFADNVIDFIKTPVEDWTQIASTKEELFEKFRETLSDPDIGKCPANLKNICKIVVVKYMNMEKYIDGDQTAVTYGDQTDEASRLLSNTA